MKSSEIRKAFLEFFEGKGHKILPSASLIPDDPTLLFTIAGMVPFKPIFQGERQPAYPRVTTSQKCIRTNDIDNVGRTARHHTFFEMLGNFSFGDYYKREAISWAWEFLFERLGLPADKAHIAVYMDDQESYDIWHDAIGVPAERIYRLGAESNFWSAGPTGPCGPCSEIYLDRGPEYGCGCPDCHVECDCDRYLEIWNLVFMQYERDEAGNLAPLPRKNIDTGAGLERLASVMQKTVSNFETDLFLPLMEKIASMSAIDGSADAEQEIGRRIIADHTRAMAFLIADGILPSNEGRGYVLRRIIRRAVRAGKVLGITTPFLAEMLPVAIAGMSDHYSELAEKTDFILNICTVEEERFLSTIGQGEALLNAEMARLAQAGDEAVSGELAFKLYDTYGYPIELTREIAASRGFFVDGAGFEALMEEQKERARSARRAENAEASPLSRELAAESGRTEFVGYEQMEITAQVTGIVADGSLVDALPQGAGAEVLLNVTPFYAEKGGQVFDTGLLCWPSGKAVVEGAYEKGDGLILHAVRVIEGELRKGSVVSAAINTARRADIARNHTAAHLLHAALRRILGTHVTQAGSQVDPERLRFDFSHFKAALSEEIRAVEKMVNECIWENIPVDTVVTDVDTARSMGAMALFGEKYGNQVRVVRVNDFSLELCGGTHVRSTGELGSFKIISESSIGSGIRRIEALTGRGSFNYLDDRTRTVDKLAEMLKAGPGEVLDRVARLQLAGKEAERCFRESAARLALHQSEALLASAETVDGIKVVSGVVEGEAAGDIRALADSLKKRIGDGIVILGSAVGGKAQLVVAAAGSALDRGLHAGNIVREIAGIIGGGGGGRPDMAQAGGPGVAGIAEAVASGRNLVRSILAERS